eukprot:51315_1
MINDTIAPSVNPTKIPSTDLTIAPSVNPTQNPSTDPTNRPSSNPAHDPSSIPITNPSPKPTKETEQPSADPTNAPTALPTHTNTTAIYLVGVSSLLAICFIFFGFYCGSVGLRNETCLFLNE